jgi:hypothetical protein
MGLARQASRVCAAVLLPLAAGAPAAQAGTHHRIAILSPDGQVRRHALPPAARAELPAPPGGAHARPHAGVAARRTVASVLRGMRSRGEISPEDYAARRAAYGDARAAVRELSGTPRRELAAVIATLDGIAARGKLTPSRVAPLWLTLERNREWWTTAPWVPAPGERVGFSDNDLVWQYYAGRGLQIQWLGTFGQLNWLAQSAKPANVARAGEMIDEILPLASSRAGGLAWEYEFPFGGGAAPWTSSLSQGTGLQALARAAQATGRTAEVAHATRKGLAIFRRRTPEGVRVKVPGGVHYAQYSFAPGLRILNGFVQSLVGLHDYAEITGNSRARKLYETGVREAEREVPTYDTGAWSLYSRGTSTHESDLGYHTLLRDFLVSLCAREPLPVFCDTAQRFTDDLAKAPVVSVPAQRLPRGRYGYVRVRLDKLSALTLTVQRGDRVVLSRTVGTLAYGTHRLGWSVPRRTGRYRVTVTARDLAGNAGGGTGTVRVVERG